MENQRKHVYLDEAGDAGFYFERGSSLYFVVACIVVNDAETVDRISEKIADYKNNLGWPGSAEIKFHSTRKQVVSDLLKSLCEEHFRIYAISIDKMSCHKSNPETSRSFYNRMICEALLCIPDLNRANIYIDGHTDKKYWKQARGIFRKTVNGDTSAGQKIDSIRFVDSKKYNLIQLADLVAGAILHSTKTNLPDARDYLSIIERKIEILTHRLL
jgi:hypothetical protein